MCLIEEEYVELNKMFGGFTTYPCSSRVKVHTLGERFFEMNNQPK